MSLLLAVPVTLRPDFFCQPEGRPRLGPACVKGGVGQDLGNLGFCNPVGLCRFQMMRKGAVGKPLGRYKKMIAVPYEHRLANKKIIELSDLYGETLMMVKKGDSGVNDFIRNDLETNHPQIKIEDTAQFYDMSVFNRCAETEHVLLTIECWQNVHPGLVTIPVHWNYSIPYGLMYSLHADPDVLKLVEKTKALLE